MVCSKARLFLYFYTTKESRLLHFIRRTRQGDHDETETTPLLRPVKEGNSYENIAKDSFENVAIFGNGSNESKLATFTDKLEAY